MSNARTRLILKRRKKKWQQRTIYNVKSHPSQIRPYFPFPYLLVPTVSIFLHHPPRDILYLNTIGNHECIVMRGFLQFYLVSWEQKHNLRIERIDQPVGADRLEKQGTEGNLGF